MSGSSDHPANSRLDHSMADWLKLHGVSAEAVGQFLSHSCRTSPEPIPPAGPGDDLPGIPVSPAQAWSVARDALAEAFPEKRVFIAQAADAVEFEAVEAPDDMQRPVTLDRSPTKAPLVSVHYRGTPADILAVAHEFGHAIQLVANNGQFIPPIQREIAAFVSELSLLGFLKSDDATIPSKLADAHHQDDAIFFAKDKRRLEDALKDETTAYSYRWNYPVARALAATLFPKLKREKLWTVFLGHMNCQDLFDYA